jgi:uncharacterized protein (TIGR02996 family)
MRTFTYSDAKSHKFWNIELQGKSFTVTYGRQGTQGQSKTKEFADEARAQKEHDKLVKEKLAKGYVETTPAAARPSSQREALEAALVENPDDLATHMAYADWLSENGDPRGEFIQVQLALEDPKVSAGDRKNLQKREEALLKKHAREWLGDLGPFLLEQGDVVRFSLGDESCNGFRFARGWIDVLQISELHSAAARACRHSPLLLLLRSFTIGEVDPDDFALKELQPAHFLGNVRTFQLGLSDGRGHHCGEYAAALIEQMPRVEELHLYAIGVDTQRLFALPLPHLRILEVNHLNQTYALDVLAANPSLGNLTTLHVVPHMLEPEGDEAYLTREGTSALMHSPHLNSLTHLYLRQSDLGDQGCVEIVRSGILKRLKVLDLWSGCITDEGARALAACPDLRRLERLNLAQNGLTQAGIDALQAVGIATLEVVPQRNAAAIEGLEYLWEGDME